MAEIIILALCVVVTAATFHAIKWMILNWPVEPEDVPAIIKWLQDGMKDI